MPTLGLLEEVPPRSVTTQLSNKKKRREERLVTASDGFPLHGRILVTELSIDTGLRSLLLTMAAMYLDGSAKLWWRTKMEERTFGMVDARSKRGTSERPS